MIGENSSNDSILLNIKDMLGLLPDDTSFDKEIISYINAAINTLTQLAVGPAEGFCITSEEETYVDFLGEDYGKNQSMVKTFIAEKVKLYWDPPTTSALIDASRQMLKEDEFRLLCENDKLE